VTAKKKKEGKLTEVEEAKEKSELSSNENGEEERVGGSDFSSGEEEEEYSKRPASRPQPRPESNTRMNVVLTVLIILILLLGATLVYFVWKQYQTEEDKPLLKNFFLSEVEEMEFTSPIEEGAVMGAHWFGRVQREDGKYVYIFDPDNNTEVKKYGYSLARHSASIYGLVWAYEYTGDERYLAAAELAAEYTFEDMKSEGDLKYIKSGSYSSLFDNALALIGVCYLYNATGSDKYKEVVEGLANVCIKSQDEEGRFDYKYDYGKFEESHMASGEALLGLALAYRVTGEEKYRTGFQLGFDYHSQYYMYRDCRNMSTAVYSWMASAFSQGYFITGEDKYKEAAYALSDWIIEREFGRFFFDGWGEYNYEKMMRYPECIGSFKSFPSMNTCTYTEGMGDVLWIAKLAGDDDKVTKYKEVLLNASTFILELQYSMEEAKEFGSPNLTAGGYRHDLFDTVNKDMGWQSRWIRIDYTQHAMGGLFRMLWNIDRDEINQYYEAYPFKDL
jgi:rhamnogalacturonyl hydrolase YesR